MDRDNLINAAGVVLMSALLALAFTVSARAEGLFVAPPAKEAVSVPYNPASCHVELSAAGTFLSERSETLAEGTIVADPIEIFPGVGVGLLEDVKVEGTKSERKLTGGVGAGCDIKLDRLFVAGAGIRADFGSDINHGSIVGRLGVAVNAMMTLYGTASWVVKDFEIGNNGALFLGGGGEVSIGDANKYKVFVEFSHAVSEFGDQFEKDDQQLRGGLRIVLGD